MRGDALGQRAARARPSSCARELAKIGKPVDRSEWGMTPPTVNAYYNPLQNNINFPAGILQPPFFERAMDDAVNFGGIGAVIGHELTHGFDDQGRKFDANGNLRDWWTEEDAKEFEKRAACVADQYGGYTVGRRTCKLNGKLTLGENIADNGGVRIAYMALDGHPRRARRAPLPTASPPSSGSSWAGARSGARTRPRRAPGCAPRPTRTRPGRYRVNGVVVEHARVPEGVRLHGGVADGARERLPGLVEGRRWPCHRSPTQPDDRRRLRRPRRVRSAGTPPWSASLYVLVSVLSAAFPGILVYLVLWLVMPESGS